MSHELFWSSHLEHHLEQSFHLTMYLWALTMRLQVGAAVLGVPVKPTIKEVDSDGQVVKTLKRANLWEVQTPQVLSMHLYPHQ